MRHLPEITKILDSGFYAGNNRPHGRVTVEPYWKLHVTDDAVGVAPYSANRGPYRWFQRADNSQFEVEVPNIKTIEIDRSVENEIATCSISMYNQSHDGEDVPFILGHGLGRPGFYWPERGKNPLADEIWGQSEALGAVDKQGNDLPTFSWKNVLVPMALLRTYQGYGGFNSDGSPMSISDAVDAGNLACTGVWIIDTVSGGTDGMMTISTRDIGRILRDQSIYPPVCPPNLYPPDYYRAGTSAFDSVWVGFNSKTGGRGRVRFAVADSNAVDGGVASCDGNWDTVSMSAKHDLPHVSSDYWEYEVSGEIGDGINGITIHPYAGGYEMYISIHDGVGWLSGTDLPGENIPYVMKKSIPWKEPGDERPIPFDLPVVGGVNLGYKPQEGQLLRIRITLRHQHYSGGSDGWGYRSGIRDVVLHRITAALTIDSGLDNGPGQSPFPYWCTNLMAHPTRGYWVVDEIGNTFGFGDAAFYDNTTDIGAGAFYEPIHTEFPVVRMVGATPHPDGRGYWLLDKNGQVFAQGPPHYGQVTTGVTPETELNSFITHVQQYCARDICATHTGEGYWVVYSDGVVRGFGDAADTPGMTEDPENPGVGFYQMETTDAMRFMEYISQRVDSNGNQWEIPFTQLRGTTIAGHPNELGFWVVNGCGEMRAVGDGVHHYGQFVERTYNKGQADEWHLTLSGEYPHSIEPTRSGNGYWIMGTSGRIAHFGDAIGKGPTSVYPPPDVNSGAPPDDPYYRLTTEELFDVFRALVWDFVKGPDDDSFYVVSGNGSTAAINTEWFGQPGYWGQSGLYWHEGNYPTPYGSTEDYVDIIREFLMWGGFYLYDPVEATNGGTPTGQNPAIFGTLESTGIATDTRLGIDQFDKQTILDCINLIKEIVAYLVYIDPEGGFHFESPNWWKAGNFYLNGKPENEAPDGSTDVSPAVAAGGYTSYIPVLHEAVNVTSYQATLNGDAYVSEIYVGSDVPRFDDRTRTNYTHFVPPQNDIDLFPTQVSHIGETTTPTSHEDVPFGRNISHPFMFNRYEMSNSEEQALFAELTALRLWFQQRVTSLTAVADPCVMINDQVRIIERNTSEVYYHYVRGIRTSMDCDTGSYTMNLRTNWVGTTDDWVITVAMLNGDDEVKDPFTHAVISERVWRWQLLNSRGLESFDDGDPTLETKDYRLRWWLE